MRLSAYFALIVTYRFYRPGTGKTVTIVEAIQQILRTNNKARILACAPSNSAADLVAQRLNHLTTKELFRLYAPAHHVDSVPGNLKPFIFTANQDHSDHRDGNQANKQSPRFSIPPAKEMKRFKVIVSTCISAAVYSGIGMARGHFTHIFVDEAGQASEV